MLKIKITINHKISKKGLMAPVSLIVLLTFLFASTALAALICTVADSCADVTVMRLSALTSNAHAELSSQSNYSYYVCCSNVTGLGNNCSDTFQVVARLSGDSNAHVERNDSPIYFFTEEQQPAGNYDKNWNGAGISGEKMIASAYGGRLYSYNGSSWSEEQPAGNLDKNWAGAGISGDKMIAAVYGGRLYSYNGSSWSEQQPAGIYSKIWNTVGISGDKMIAAVYGGRLYSYNGSSWSEQQPAGDYDKNWGSVGISGEKMIAAVQNGRLYYYNGSSWSEQQPAGDYDENWYAVGISGGKMIAGVAVGRLYSYNGSSWSEQQPAGDNNKNWNGVGISGEKMIAAVHAGRLYYYNGNSWSEQQPAGNNNKEWFPVGISGEKMMVGEYTGRLYQFGFISTCLSITSGTVDVAYGANCDGYDTIVASMSGATTNAHVGNDVAYPNKICASATATAAVSITITGDPIAYGHVAWSGQQNTINLGKTQIVQNAGAGTIALEVKSSQATDGTQWTMAESIGIIDEFVHEFSTTTSPTWEIFDLTPANYKTATSSVPAGDSQNFDFQITAPDQTTDFDQKSITITVHGFAS